MTPATGTGCIVRSHCCGAHAPPPTHTHPSLHTQNKSKQAHARQTAYTRKHPLLLSFTPVTWRPLALSAAPSAANGDASRLATVLRLPDVRAAPRTPVLGVAGMYSSEDPHVFVSPWPWHACRSCVVERRSPVKLPPPLPLPLVLQPSPPSTSPARARRRYAPNTISVSML